MQHDSHVQTYRFWRRLGLMVLRPFPVLMAPA